MHLSINNRLDEVFVALDRVDELLCGGHLALPLREDIHLALEELLVNTVRHGYPDGRSGRIDIQIGITAETITVELRDDGIAYDPLEQPIPILSGDHSCRTVQGGLGVHLVRAVTHEVCYAREGQDNHLVLRFDQPRHLRAPRHDSEPAQ